MKQIIALTLVISASGFSCNTQAEPLVYTDSTRIELQKAHDNRDIVLVAYEYATIKINRFCKSSNAHINKTEWTKCIDAVEGLAFGEKMERLAEIEEAKNPMPVNLYHSTVGRY